MSNIDEDIKYVKECLKLVRVFFKAIKKETDYKEIDDVAFCIAIDNILEERKQDKKRIKELEEENKIFVQNGSNVKLEIYIKNNYIPKQKVKDKIKDLEYNSDLGFEKSLEEIFKIEVLEELLEEA